MKVTDIGPDGTPLETGTLARSDNYAGYVSWAAKIGDDIAAGISIKGVYNVPKVIKACILQLAGTNGQHLISTIYVSLNFISVTIMNHRDRS